MNSSNKVVACLIAVLVLVSFAFVSFAEEAPDVTVAPTTNVPVTEATTAEDYSIEVSTTRELGSALDESEPYETVTFEDRTFVERTTKKPATTKAPTHDSFGTGTDSFGTGTDSFGTDTDSFGTETDSEEGGFLGFFKGIINKIIYFFMKIFAYLGLS